MNIFVVILGFRVKFVFMDWRKEFEEILIVCSVAIMVI